MKHFLALFSEDDESALFTAEAIAVKGDFVVATGTNGEVIGIFSAENLLAVLSVDPYFFHYHILRVLQRRVAKRIGTAH